MNLLQMRACEKAPAVNAATQFSVVSLIIPSDGAVDQSIMSDQNTKPDLPEFYRTFSYCPYRFHLCQNWLRTLRMSDA